jgi:SAM-dependent methyltransferase
MMKLSDQLHCPHCKSRLAASSAEALHCTICERTITITNGVADFLGASPPPGTPDLYRGDPRRHEGARALFTRIQTATTDRWPNSLGDTIEFGCGLGETTYAIAASQKFRSLLVLDSEMEMIQACRSRIAPLGLGSERPVAYATLSGAQDVVRDAVADTVIGTGVLPGIADARAFLAMVHRILKPNGRALFVAPNGRYYQAMCLAMAEALVQRYARNGVWPDGQQVALELLAHTRRLLVHRGNMGFLTGVDVRHLFDSNELEDLGLEVGFTTAETIPLDPDPVGTETTRRICHEAGAPDSFTETFGMLASAVGQPFFNLLNRQDSSASMLLWMTKGSGPSVRIFTHRPAPQKLGEVDTDAALGGVAPRWSVELLARDKPDGIVVTLGGWCLCNTDVLWVRLTLNEVTRHAPVWRPRPDVHEVLNRGGVFHPLNTLCSGMASELSFEGIHAVGNTHPFRLDIVLASGVVVTGPAPEFLVMDEQMVIAH